MNAPHAAWRALGLAAGLATTCLLPADALAAPLDLTVDAGVRHQEMDGFGTTLAYWLTEPYNQDAFRTMYYRDLGASMLRMDFHHNVLTSAPGDLATPVVLGTDIDQNITKFDFEAFGVKVFGDFAAAGAQKKLDEFRLIGSIWTPPHWMKGPEITWSTGEPNGTLPQIDGLDSLGGSLIDTEENLQQFARYVSAYVKGMEQHFGVPVYAISLQNELVFSEPYNSAVYSPELYVKALKAVGREFERNGITTKIQGPEDVGVGVSSDPWVLWRQMQFINAVRADPEAAGYLDIYSIHGYAGDGFSAGGSSTGAQMWQQYLHGRSAEDYPTPAYAWWEGVGDDGKQIWMTETGGGQQAWDVADQYGNQNGALGLAVMMHEAIVHGDVSAYLHWQTANDQPAGTGTLTEGTDTSSRKYSAAKHFYRYIRPGAQRVEVSSANVEGVLTSAFVHDEQQSLTLVLINTGTEEKELSIDISSILGAFSPDEYLAFRTSESETFLGLPDLVPQDGRLIVTLPGKSVTTVYGVVPEPAFATGSLMAGLLLLRRRRRA